jgi:hypothetical protein
MVSKKTLLSLIKLEDNDKTTLFNSISSKLNILDPKVYNPIYTKILETDQVDTTENHIFDSKYKIKEVITKIIEEDKNYGSEADEKEELEDNIDDDDKLKLVSEHRDIEDMDNNVNVEDDILNNNLDVDIDQNIDDNDSDGDSDSDNDSDIGELDAETEEAISNTFTILGNVEKVNKTTGEKIITQEKIFVKKSPLLEPLKVMQDLYVIPSTISNKSIDDTSIKNTNTKLNSYNNSTHVESLFLYLANKLVEVGKCPAFPYYYGSINGVDPNYHHNITDEYEGVYRTKWFRDRVKNDFDLLIIEDESESVNSMIEKMYKDYDTHQHSDTSDNESNESNDDDYEDIDEDTKSTDDEMITTEPNTTDENTNTGSIEINQTSNEITTPEQDSTIVLEGGNDLEVETLTDEVIDNIGKTDDEEFILNLDEMDLSIDINEEESKQEVQETEENLDFVESLSDFDKDNCDLSDFEDDGKYKMYYLKCANIPVSLCLMEHMDKTLDETLDDGYNMDETEWFAVFFQISFGLAIAQKYFNFVHNDLHSDNIMFKSTPMKYLYYEINGKYYRVPTFNKIAKIIDFARGTFKFGDRWVFSDQFSDDGEACGQYDYPVDGSLKNCEFKPNPSFDLVRLGTTVIERIDELPKVTEFVENLCMDDDGHCVCYNEDTFQLYIDIARTCHNAVPIEVLQNKEFNKFKIAKEKIPKGAYVFKY